MVEASSNDSARNYWIAFALLLGVPTVLVAGCWIRMEQIEQLRIRDAKPAFEPLRKLQPVVFSNPAPFGRYVMYYVEFAESSNLSDENVSTLESLNNLPQQNELELWIKTERVTDASIPSLLKIRTLDGLDVSHSAISDEGIEELVRGLPDTKVMRRTRS